MAEYKSNSRKSHKDDDNREEKKQKVTNGAVKVTKPSKEKPNVRKIIFGDLGMIFSELKENVFIPGIINLSEDIWHSMGDSVFEQITGHSSSTRHRRDRDSYKSYDGYYKPSKKKKKRYRDDDDDDDRPRKKSYGRYSIYEIEFEDLADARSTRRSMIEQLDEFDFVSVKDYYDYAGFEGWDYTDYPQDWGWDDLDPHLRIDETRDGYVLRLPRPIPFD